MNCPKCIGKLGKKSISLTNVHDLPELRGASVSQELEIDQCFVCGGVWFDKGELEKYATEQITVVDSLSLGKDLDQQLDSKKGNCPLCRIPMKKAVYEKEPTIQLDVCEKCGGVWLDSTEIDRMERASLSKLSFFSSFIKGLKKPT